MDSFAIFVRDAEEKEVADFLSTLAEPFTYELLNRPTRQWNVPTLDKKEVLYVRDIEWTQSPPREGYDEEILDRHFKGISFVQIPVDVSFRIQGTQDIKWFVKTMLTRFKGCALDGFWYGDTPFFLEDLDDDSKHGFFERDTWVAAWNKANHTKKTQETSYFLDQKRLRPAFPTVDSFTRALSSLVVERSCQEIEDLRIRNSFDYSKAYPRYTPIVEPLENYSGIEDCFRFPNYDPEQIAYYKQPVYVAVRAHGQIVACGSPVSAGFYMINQGVLKGEHTLHVSFFSPGENIVFENSYLVNVVGGDVCGQLLKDGILMTPDSNGGIWHIKATLKDSIGKIVASGQSQLLAVNWRDQKLSGKGAVYEIGSSALDFLRHQKGLEVLPYKDSIGPLDWIIVARAPCPAIAELGSKFLRTADNTDGVSVKFFEGEDFTKQVSERTMSSLDFEWKDEIAPDAALPANSPFGMRWYGFLMPPVTGAYFFEIKGAETAILKINGAAIELKMRDFDKPRMTASNKTPVDLIANDPALYELEVTESMSGGKLSVTWKIADLNIQNPEALIARARKDGTKIILADFADQWMPFVSKALGTFSFNPDSDVFKLGGSWEGGVYFALNHPLFKDLPVNQAMSWPYKGVLNTGRTYYGLKDSGEELAAGCWNYSPFGYASAVGVFPFGRGQIIFSTLDICPHLHAPEGRFEVARKLLCNYVEFAMGDDHSSEVTERE